MEMKILGVDEIVIDEMRVIYVRYTGSYEGFAATYPTMIGKLYNFALSNNLIIPGKTKILTCYHDNPEITENKNLRTSVCLSVPNNAVFEEIDEIGSMGILGKYAVGHFESFLNEEGAAWEHMYREWVPNSKYQLRDTFPFIEYVSDPNINPGGKQLFDIYIQIEPLGSV